MIVCKKCHAQCDSDGQHYQITDCVRDEIKEAKAKISELQSVIDRIADEEEFFSIPNGSQTQVQRFRDELQAIQKYAKQHASTGE